MRLPQILLVASLVASFHAPALSQTVAMPGMLGGKALLIVDGGLPRSVAVGEAFKGVKVVATSGDEAVVEINGVHRTLRVGEGPASVGANGGAAPRGNKIVLTAGSGGHFLSQGTINGRAVQFMVDTGASALGLSDQHELSRYFSPSSPLSLLSPGVAASLRHALSALQFLLRALSVPLPDQHQPSSRFVLDRLRVDDHVRLDQAAFTALTLFPRAEDTDRNMSLYGVLNHARTAMGSKMIAAFIRQPLTSRDHIGQILQRQRHTTPHGDACTRTVLACVRLNVSRPHSHSSLPSFLLPPRAPLAPSLPLLLSCSSGLRGALFPRL